MERRRDEEEEIGEQTRSTAQESKVQGKSQQATFRFTCSLSTAVN